MTSNIVTLKQRSILETNPVDSTGLLFDFNVCFAKFIMKLDLKNMFFQSKDQFNILYKVRFEYIDSSRAKIVLKLDLKKYVFRKQSLI
ncbi:hypothetical protein [Mythimna sequax nucleopolyhedrovirus]|nr:hypothetical protein [Mythimna sequax nucleopolyhedrovirus]